MTGGRCGGSKPLRWLRCFQAETFAKPYFVLFVILTLNEVEGKNLYQTKNKILHFSMNVQNDAFCKGFRLPEFNTRHCVVA